MLQFKALIYKKNMGQKKAWEIFQLCETFTPYFVFSFSQQINRWIDRQIDRQLDKQIDSLINRQIA